MTQFARLKGLIDTDLMQNAHVVLFGAGSGGQQLAVTLATADLGNLTLVDADIVEAHNLGTTDLTLADLGRSKVESAKAAIAKVNPATHVTTFACRDLDIPGAELQAIVANADLVLQLTDSLGAAYRINALALAVGTPVLNAGTHAGSRAFEVIATNPGSCCYACVALDRYMRFKTHGEPRPQSYQASRLGAHLRNATLEYATLGYLHAMAGSTLDVAQWGHALRANPAWIGRTALDAFTGPGGLFSDVPQDVLFGVRAINPPLPDGYCCPECGRTAPISTQPKEDITMGA